MRMVSAFVRIFFVVFALLDTAYVHSWRVGSVGRLLTVNRSVKSLALHGRKPKVQASAPAVIVSPFDPSQGKGAEGEGINVSRAHAMVKIFSSLKAHAFFLDSS